jgi:P-type conjugative transfer protein TrbL
MHLLLQVAPPPIVTPNDLINDFKIAARTWEPLIRNVGTFLMAAFLTVDMALSARRKAGEGADYPELVNFMAGKILTWGVFWAFLTLNWPHIIIDGFIALGKRAGGITDATTASALFAAGANICGALWKAGSPAGLMFGPITAIPFIVAGVFILAAFAWLAVHYVKFTLEAVISISNGLLFLGFAPLEATRQYAERYITLILAAGFRLQCFYLMLSVANRLADIWQRRASGVPLTTDSILSAFIIAFEAALYGYLCYAIPVWVSACIQGSVAFAGDKLTAFVMPYLQAGTLAAGMAVTGGMSGVGAAAAMAPGAFGSISRAIGGAMGGNNGGNQRGPSQPSPSFGSSFGRAPQQPRP